MNTHICSWLHTLNPCTWRRKPKPKPNPESRSDTCLSVVPRLYTPRQYRIEELARATDDFSTNCLLGEGGYGSVYRAVFSSGSEAAIKKMTVNGTSNLHERSFAAELATLGNVRHRNLVLFKGWCFSRTELFLVYDYMPNKSLDTHLFFPCHENGGRNLPWSTRCQIAKDIAEGLFYLHDVAQIVHRDIKSANVLLDSDLQAYISDFGLARMVNRYNTVEPPNSSIFSEKTLGDGSHGYTAPEFIGVRAEPTPMSDVFSFGVVLFEILSARKAETSSTGFLLVDWIHSLFSQNCLLTALDPQLARPSAEEEMLGLFYLGLHSTQLEATRRPTMNQALRWLHDLSKIKPPNIRQKPNFYGAILRDSMLDVRSASSSLLRDEELAVNLEHCSDLVRAPQAFQWKDIYVATHGLSDWVGRGSMGGIYRGQMHGQLVAVKVSRNDLSSTSMDFVEMQTDMQILGSIRHTNIMRLIGWSSDPTTGRRALVYDYMPNGSLHDCLAKKDREVLPWNVRFRIAKELAAALFHLHENCGNTPIIHRDVKAYNVLLDSEFHVRLSGLGLGVNAITEVHNGYGTIGYLDPEYALTSILTKYADVYSYGVILLQLVAGINFQFYGIYPLERKNTFENEREVVSIPIDRKLEGCYNESEANLLFGLGLICCCLLSRGRPDMRTVLDILHFHVPLHCPFSLNTCNNTLSFPAYMLSHFLLKCIIFDVDVSQLLGF